MAKIDEVKEILNTLRVIFSVLVGVFVVLVSGLIKRIDNGKIDIYFFIGIGIGVLLIFLIGLVLVKIVNKTNDIKDL